MKKYIHLTLMNLFIPLLFVNYNIESAAADSLKDGDIIFQEIMSQRGTALKHATGSRYTHVGIIYRDGSKYKVLEAISPVSITPLDRFIARGKNHHYVIKRLKNAESILTPETVKKMKEVGKTFPGKKYDSRFLWSDDQLYCSELVWKIYKRGTGIEVGTLQKFRDFNLSHPEVKSYIKRYYGRKEVPMDEPVISPVRMLNSPLLVTVEEKNQ